MTDTRTDWLFGFIRFLEDMKRAGIEDYAEFERRLVAWKARQKS